MPLSMLLAHVEQMEPLRAGEALTAANATALGGGNLERNAARSLSRDWQRLAEGDTPRRTPPPAVLAAQLDHIGFHVVVSGGAA